ncbi:MAG: hypothetical protein JXA44_03785 [Methanospirillaceae archaeon]|nr:hypothetical protein [Methanospirillaceae archaeon]
MNNESRIPAVVSFAAMAVLLLVTELGAVLLASPMASAGYAAFEDPESLTNPIYFIGVLILFTLLLLVLIRYRFSKIFSLIVWISIAIAYGYVFYGILGFFSGDVLILCVITLVLTAVSVYALIRYPEWWVIDILGVLMAAGIASIFGISLEPVPVILLLTLLSVYDAVSVYKTRHMITLADTVLSSRLPIMVMVPKRKDFSYVREGSPGIAKEGSIPEQEEKRRDRGAFFIGLGDLIMPSILVVSADTFLFPEGSGLLTIPCITTIIGSLAGLILLFFIIGKGQAHAGLPPLNGGAIIGCIIGILITAGM